MNDRRLLILGASARAAAGSALRAGLQPLAADLFADRDLAAIAPSVRVDFGAYPAGLASAAGTFPACPWIYTGAIENHPDLVDRIALDRPLWGNPGPVLRAVRDPSRLAVALRSAGLSAPEVREDGGDLSRDGSWLIKPRASASGRSIRPWVDGSSDFDGRSYAQRRISGDPIGAIFLAASGRAEFLGATRSIVGRAGSPFAYCGSVGPIPLEPRTGEILREIGRTMAREFGLAGLFGVDAILAEGVPWPVEVNPRYTASVEVLELATGRSFLADHARAFGGVAGPVGRLGRMPGVVGKRIVFAPVDGRFPFSWTGHKSKWPKFGDIPAAGEPFRRGDPVLTVFARAVDVEGCLRSLGKRVDRWERRLAGRDFGGEGGGMGPGGEYLGGG